MWAFVRANLKSFEEGFGMEIEMKMELDTPLISTRIGNISTNDRNYSCRLSYGIINLTKAPVT